MPPGGRLEFMSNRAKPWLLSALGIAVFTFSILAIGQNVTGENSGVAELYIYKPANWISGRVER